MNRPTDFKKGITLHEDAQQTRALHMEKLEARLIEEYKSLDDWETFSKDGTPLVYEIQKQLLIKGEIMRILGDLAGECERFALWCDAHKKNEREQYLIKNQSSAETAKMREIKADMAGKKYRINRDYFKGLGVFWRNRIETTKEEINILKWIIKDAHKAKEGM